MGVWNQKASKGGDGFEKAPPGNHPAVCVAIIDLGTQENTYNGVTTWQRRAYFCWELVTEKREKSDRNHVVGIDLTVSLNEKAKLRKWIESRAGKQFPEGYEHDISKELGKPCLLMVKEHNGYPKVDGMNAVPKGMTVPSPQNTPFIWSLDDREEGQTPDFPDWLPYLYGDKLADVVMESAEVRKVGPCAPKEGGGVTKEGAAAIAAGEDEFENPDDIPF